jgi:hypothetical protein
MLPTGGFSFPPEAMQGGCVGKVRIKVFELSKFDGGVAGGVGWCDTVITRSCMELEPRTLNSCPA